jgi:plastocyanin
MGRAEYVLFATRPAVAVGWPALFTIAKKGEFMQRRTGAVALACIATAAIALPAAASARTKTVIEGAPSSIRHLVPKAFLATYSPDVNDFFLHKVTINQGDAISFVVNGFHNVDLPGASGKDLPLVTAGAIVTGAKDAAGTPFWFNRRVPALGLNHALLASGGGTTYDGSTRVYSGLPLGPPRPFKVTFTKAGTYKYFCDVHPGMIGYVVVLAKGKPVPSAKQDAAALAKQLSADVAAAKKLAATKVAAGHVSLGVSNANGVELFAMFPATLRVKPGAIVTFSMSKASREVHSATFGPKSYLKTLADSFSTPNFLPAATYPSSGMFPVGLASTSHGNGFANTGLVDADAATPTIPLSGKIKFLQAGTYHYICVVHAFMRGTVIVK